MSAHRRRGFTLIELLVAIAIFGAIAAIAYGSVASLIRARDRLDAQQILLRSVQTSMAQMERDVRSAVARPVREPYGDVRPALMGDRASLAFTRLRSGGLADRRSHIQRVGYAWSTGKITRVAWPVADAAPSSQPSRRVLLESAERMSVRYLDAQGQWREVWPAANTDERLRLIALPRAIDLRIMIKGFGEVRRVIELAESPAE